MTVIRSLLSYASEECIDIMPLSASSKTIQSLSTPAGEIEYFEDYQMKAILNAPSTEKQSECRNKMLLILGYDAAMRIGEMTKLKVGSLFLDAEKPYIRRLGKEEKYRSVPLMEKMSSICAGISGNSMVISQIWKHLYFILLPMADTRSL